MSNPLLAEARQALEAARTWDREHSNTISAIGCVLRYLEERHEAGRAPQVVPESRQVPPRSTAEQIAELAGVALESKSEQRAQHGSHAYERSRAETWRRDYDELQWRSDLAQAALEGDIDEVERALRDRPQQAKQASSAPVPAALDLDALQRLCDAATSGPWDGECGDYDCLFAPDGQAVVIMGGYRDAGTHQRNARFVAAARDALPKLIAEVRRLRTRPVCSECNNLRTADGDAI